MILGQATGITGVGLLVGTLGALAFARAASHLLFGVVGGCPYPLADGWDSAFCRFACRLYFGEACHSGKSHHCSLSRVMQATAQKPLTHAPQGQRP